MGSINPKLNDLLSKYYELVNNVENNRISYKDAVEILSNLVVIDDSGAEWRVSENGLFLRSLPGETPHPYQPEGFIEINNRPLVTENSVLSHQEIKKEIDRSAKKSLMSSLQPILNRIPRLPKSSIRFLIVLILSSAMILIMINSKNATSGDPKQRENRTAQDTINKVIADPSEAVNYIMSGKLLDTLSYSSKIIGAAELGFELKPGEIFIDEKFTYVDLYLYKDEELVAVWEVPVEESGGIWYISGEPRNKK